MGTRCFLCLKPKKKSHTFLSHKSPVFMLHGGNNQKKKTKRNKKLKFILLTVSVFCFFLFVLRYLFSVVHFNNLQRTVSFDTLSADKKKLCSHSN